MGKPNRFSVDARIRAFIMGGRKKYEPHCPAQNCIGGYEERLHQISAEAAHLTPEVLKRREDKSSIYRCSYCGFVWFQKSSTRPGLDPTPAGKWDSPQRPGEFYALPITFEIREQNTRAFWDEHFDKLRKSRAKSGRKPKARAKRHR